MAEEMLLLFEAAIAFPIKITFGLEQDNRTIVSKATNTNPDINWSS
jgi:hypothetical protein